jgi:hypothetical protein
MSSYLPKEQQISSSSSKSRILGDQAVNNCRDSRYLGPFLVPLLLFFCPVLEYLFSFIDLTPLSVVAFDSFLFLLYD